jgi:hypothetical protein
MSSKTWTSPGLLIWWVVASTLGVALGYGMRSAFLLPVIAVLTIGILVAIIQGLVLRQHIPTIGWWLLASIVGLAWGAVIGIAAIDIGVAGFVVGIIVLGASYGMMQGLALFATAKRWLGMSISLPIIALLGWFLYEQVPIWATPMPRFVDSGRVEMGGCRGAAELYEAEPVGYEQVANITRLQASNVANRVVYRHFGVTELPGADYLGLVQATFQDGQRRLAWYKVVTIETYALESKASIVYVDALTGEPLVFVTDVWLTYDPCMSILSCGCPIILHLSPRQYFILGLLVSYLLVLTIVFWRGMALEPLYWWKSNE